MILLFKNTLLHIASVLLACAVVFYLSFYRTGIYYAEGIKSVMELFASSALIYVLCLVVSPLLCVYISCKGRAAYALLVILLVITASGGLFLLLPLFDVLAGGFSPFFVAAIPSVLLGAFMPAGELASESRDTVKIAYERGLKSSYITTKLLLRFALSLFLKYSGRLFAFISAVFALSKILLGSFSISPSFIGLWAIALLLFELLGFILHKCTNGR